MGIKFQDLAPMHAASKDAGRLPINGVNIGKDGSAGTNGHVLAMVRNEDDESMLGLDSESVTIPLDVAKDLAKAIKKLPASQRAELESQGERSARLSYAGVSQEFPLEPSEFPNVDAVLPTAEPEFTVGIGIEVLETLIKVARHYTGERQRILEFRFSDNLSVFEVKVQGADERLRLVAMPARV